MDPSDWTTKILSEKAEPTAERYPRLNPTKNLAKHVLAPCDCTTKNLSGKAVKYPSLRADECRRGNPVKNTALSCHSELVSESVTRYEQESNIGQTLKRSCSTRAKRHREKRGFRLVPLLARAVQGDKFLSLRVGLTMAARLSRFHNGLVGLRSAFTMAEILLSLTIIGVVAAITLPSLTGNINERTWNTQRKALYARFSQALPLMDALNGYGTLAEMTDSATGSTSIEDTTAETFVTSGLSKVLKINNICDNEHLEDCGVTSKITTLNGSQIDMPTTMQELNEKMVGSYSNTHDKFSLLDTKAAAFETQNGESITVFYNPRCLGSLNEMPAGLGGGFYMQPKVCANFIYDLNGNKGPNTVGKDIGFMTALYPFDAVLVAPYPAVRPLDSAYSLSSDSGVSASQACTNYDSEYRLPNADEMAAMFVNKILLKSDLTGIYWSSTTFSSGGAWAMHMTGGQRDDYGKTTQLNVWCVWCVKR